MNPITSRWYLRGLLLGVGVGAVYFAVSRLSLRTAVPPENIATIWPPSGVALAALLLSSRRTWWFLVPSLLLWNVLANVAAGNPLGASAGFAVANALEPLMGALLLERVAGRLVRFDTQREVVGLVIACAGAAAGLTAVLGAAVARTSLGAPYWRVWRLWWIADAVGILVVAPAIVTVATDGVARLVARFRRDRPAAVLLSVGIVVVSLLTFTSSPATRIPFLRFPYLVLPLIYWTALRLGPIGATTGSLIVAAFAVFGTRSHLGTFAAIEDPTDSVLALQGWLAVVAATALSFGVESEQRRTAEHSVRAGREELQAILDHSPALISVKDLDGRYLLANRRLCEALGERANHVLGATDRELWPAEVARAIVENDRRAAADGEPRIAEEVLPAAHTSRTYLTVRFPLLDVDRTRYATCAISTDVTERIESERAAARLAAIVDAADDAVFSKALDGTITSWNHGAERLYGYTAEEAIGRNISMVAPPGRENEVPAILERIARGGPLERFETVRRRKDGRLVDVSLTISPIRERSGRVIAASVIGHDITEAKRRQELLRASEERLRAVVDTARQAIISADSRGDLIAFNPGAEHMFGWRSQDVIGQPISILMPERYRQAHRTGLRRYLDTGEARVIGTMVELEGLHRDGIEFPIELSLSVWAAGGDRYFTAIINDVTERKRTEAELQEHRAELERSNRELAQFASVASHDLQEPLRMVASYVQLLAQDYERKLGPEADQFIRFAVDGAKRMQELIGDLLAYSRVDSGERASEAVDLRTALVAAMENLALAISDAGAMITNGDLPTVRGDRSQLVQLFQNLLGNALKFRGEGVPQIHVDSERRDGEWMVWVQDNGIGIEPRHFERIFAVFQRLHARESYPGTGIGLAVCRKIVERHGGRIWVESEPARGARFCFTLPSHDRAGGR